MKKVIIILICILVSGVSALAQFAINTDESNPDNSAMLDVKSASKGILIPRMTFTERDAILNPANGLMVFCTNCGLDGSLSIYSNNLWRTFAPCSNSAPTAGTHVAGNTSIVWNWNAVPDATGYKWSASNNYANAIDMGILTSKTETGLSCGNLYTRYLWAYNSCGVSALVTLTQATSGTISTPVAGNHVPDFSSIIWNWSSVIGADGYKWSTTNNYANAIDMGTNLTHTETNLSCGTLFTRYVWAYNSCGYSTPATLSSSTLPVPPTPDAGTHAPTYTTIVWNWTPVTGAVGYKWSTQNQFSGATDMGTLTTKTETGLVCGTNYNRYVWAYNTCGPSIPVTLTQSTSACFVCGDNLIINHLVSGGVAPVDKTVTYGTVTNIPGETTKCWITKNLGATQQATAVDDATEASAGWYWQFDKKQGYKHDGTTRTPNTTWISTTGGTNNWLDANDPCILEFGNGWRLPTGTEWINVDAATGGNWTTWLDPWNSNLKMHTAGDLRYTDGTLLNRGGSTGYGYYWSSTYYSTTSGKTLYFNTTTCAVLNNIKANGYTVRCIR